MKNNMREGSFRNIVIKLRFCKAESSIKKYKRKIAKLNAIITVLKREQDQRQSSDNHLLNDLADNTEFHLHNYEQKKGKFTSRIVKEEERKLYLRELDMLSVKERFAVYFSHLSDFFFEHSTQIAAIFCICCLASAIAFFVTGFSTGWFLIAMLFAFLGIKFCFCSF